MSRQPNRKYLSGNEKRKLQKERKEAIAKLPSVATFFTSSSVDRNQSGKIIDREYFFSVI